MSSPVYYLQKVLSECQYDPPRRQFLYDDLSRLLKVYPSLSARVSFPQSNMFRASILEVYGTIPVLYQGATYNIPIQILYPPGYPTPAPLLRVTPTPEMTVRPSEHTHQDGTANFDILRRWTPQCTTHMLVEEAKKNYSRAHAGLPHQGCNQPHRAIRWRLVRKLWKKAQGCSISR